MEKSDHLNKFSNAPVDELVVVLETSHDERDLLAARKEARALLSWMWRRHPRRNALYEALVSSDARVSRVYE